MFETDLQERQLHQVAREYRAALEGRDFVTMANLTAQYIQSVSAKYGYQYSIEHWGVCPECLKTDGCYHIGRDEWFVCHKHKVKWYVGSNLFSAWRTMTTEQFKENANLLDGYKEIKEIHLIEGPYPKSDSGNTLVKAVVEGPKPESILESQVA